MTDGTIRRGGHLARRKKYGVIKRALNHPGKGEPTRKICKLAGTPPPENRAIVPRGRGGAPGRVKLALQFLNESNNKKPPAKKAILWPLHFQAKLLTIEWVIVGC